MATNFTLKPFRFNIVDLNFIQTQINFKPLFDVDGNAIVNWDGTGNVYDAHGAQYDTTTQAKIDALGTSYNSLTDLRGLRDVTGQNNNLLLVNKFQGAVDQPFLQSVAPNFANYVNTLDIGVAAVADDSTDAGAFYANKQFTISTTAEPGKLSAQEILDAQNTAGGPDYTKVQGPNNLDGTQTANSANGGNIVDYTPRMISQLITTGGSKPLLDANDQVVHWNAALYAAGTDTAYNALIDSVSTGGAGLIEGATVIQHLGILAGGQHDPQDPTNGEVFYGAINPGVAPGNSFLAYFGQFFDHGLDFIGKGGGLEPSKITIPLALDDPLYRAPNPLTGDPGNTKITVSRADISGFDANGNAQWVNHTSPYIDQSQTYGSHAQMTALLREWVSTDNNVTFHAGAHLFDGETSAQWTNSWGETTTATLPTLNELRAHLVATGRDDLNWDDVSNLRNRDAVTGDVVAGNSGQALLLDMNPNFTLGTGHISLANLQALDSHVTAVLTGAAAGAGLVVVQYDNGPDVSLAQLVNFANFSVLPVGDGVGQITLEQYKIANEILLESVGDHYIAGDGRVNENIALTTIHHVFHEEHNFQVRNIQEAILAQDVRAVALGDAAGSVAHDWQVATAFTDLDGNYLVSAGGAISWDESKLFDAAKLTVEMEYQHAAVDQYARTITPDIAEFVGYNSGENATVSLEYAQGAFRFGHSTMRETIDFMDPNGSITGRVMSVALEQAFLNPALFAEKGAASIAMGMTHQQMNEVDELLTPAMNTGLLGQPLDLAAINIARGRDIGLPTLNDFREAINLTRYVSWADFGNNMVHPESLVNFIAAYSFDGDLAKAQAIIGLEDGSIAETISNPDPLGTPTIPNPAAMGFTVSQAIDFLSGGDLGFNHIDTWLGGLAEVHIMGGLLGETFNAVFVDQISRLMDGDRFYYLYRLNNLNMGDEIANAQLKDIVERNTGVEHLNGSVFAYADQYVDLSASVDPLKTTGDFKGDHKYGDVFVVNDAAVGDPAHFVASGDAGAVKAIAGAGLGVYTTKGTNTSTNGNIITVGGVQYVRDIRAENLSLPNVSLDGLGLDGAPTTGADSNEVMIATDNDDIIYAWAGDDTVYAEGGNDVIYGGAGIDRLYGGDGNDTIYGGDSGDLIDGGAGDDILWGESSGTAAAGLDQIIGGEGNDIIHGGIGIDKISGGAGDDIIFGEGETDAFTHGGDGNDYLDGGAGGDLLWGDDGSDLIVGGNDQDIVAGLNGDDILRPGNPSSAMGVGPDEVMGGSATDDLGADGRGHGFDLVDLSDYSVSPTGATVTFSTQQNPAGAIDVAAPFAWVGIEGAIGSRNNDIITADATIAANPVTLLDAWTDNNWLIGGSGNDTLTGGLGNDVIVGDGIRLDTLIGTYTKDPVVVGGDRTPSTYTNDFDGASHRAFGLTSTAAERVIGTNGLLDLVGFEKHFTTLLQSDMYKNYVLGGDEIGTINGVAGTRTGDGGLVGTADTVVFTGNRADYSVTEIVHAGITAYKVVDSALGRDGTDVVVGVENFKFADGVLSGTTFNFAPVIDGGATAAKMVDENSTAVATISATDANNVPGDLLNPQTLTYRVSGGADAAKFAINAASGALSFVSAPNFEVLADANGDGVYDVIVEVSDGTLTDTQAIAVTVGNVNEAPAITSNLGGATAAITVAENATTAVTQVTAADVDTPTTLTYSIVGADAALFDIDINTGVLSFKNAPNFEDKLDAGADNVYNVDVVVTDDGMLSDTQAIAVTVGNVNEAPAITSNLGGATAAITVAENTTAVTQVTAVDVDAATTLSYLITGADADKFTINASGALSFITVPNFEAAPTDANGDGVYDVIVEVSDGTLTDTQAIAVTVGNVNEAPAITSNLGGATAAITVAENATTAVTQVTAADVDTPTTLTYSIVGADAALFDIDINRCIKL
ncbi:MAG: heme peroxidase [Methylotenera sp.]|nr:heme peroxidase [Methylotenera sp.]